MGALAGREETHQSYVSEEMVGILIEGSGERFGGLANKIILELQDALDILPF